MLSDYKTTITYFVVVVCFCYAVYKQNATLANALTLPLIVMWLILKTNSKELVKDLLSAIKDKWRK